MHPEDEINSELNRIVDAFDLLFIDSLNPIEAKERLQNRILDNSHPESMILCRKLLTDICMQQDDFEGALIAYKPLDGFTDAIDYSRLADIYKENELWAKAEISYYKALNLCNTKKKPLIYRGLGFCKSKQGKYHEAVEDYLVELKIYEENDFPFGQASALNNMAYIHYKMNHSLLCIQYAQNALEIIEKNNLKSANLLFSCYDTLGCGYESNGQLEQAQEAFLKACSFSPSLGKREFVAKSLISLGNIYMKQNLIKLLA